MTEVLRIDPIEEAIEEIKAGKMIVLIDDDDRENEGDDNRGEGRISKVIERPGPERARSRLFGGRRGHGTGLPKAAARGRK